MGKFDVGIMQPVAYSSIKELAELAIVPKIENEVPVTRYLRSANLLLGQGNTYLEEGDLEQAYVMLLKYAELMLKLRKRKDFGKTNIKDLKIVLDNLEEYKSILNRAYAERDDEVKREEAERLKREHDEMMRNQEIEVQKRTEEQANYERKQLQLHQQMQNLPVSQLNNINSEIKAQQSQYSKYGHSEPSKKEDINSDLYSIPISSSVSDQEHRKMIEGLNAPKLSTSASASASTPASSMSMASFGSSSGTSQASNLPSTNSTPAIVSGNSYSSSQHSQFSTASQPVMMMPYNNMMPYGTMPAASSMPGMMPPMPSMVSMPSMPGQFFIPQSVNPSAPPMPRPIANNVVPPRSNPPAKSPPSTRPPPGGLRQVNIDIEMLDAFMELAKANTKRDIETCGILTGNLKQNVLHITHLVIPKQEGSSDTCSMTHEEEILEYQDSNNLLTFGWIHTHPSHDCFMSSVDMHTHSSYQLMLKEAIAIVMAPRMTPNYGIFGLTDPFGVQSISSCDKRGFHPHDRGLYKNCSHVNLRRGSPNFKVADLRRKS